MGSLLLSLFFFVIVYSQQLLRLNIKETTQLHAENSIFSTLGLFKIILRKSACSLQIFSFNDTDYVSKGFYNSISAKTDCQYLQIQDGKLITSAKQQFLKVGSGFNQSTIFTIDDLGVIRLIGTYINLNRATQKSFEINITTFYTPNKYIFSGSQLNVKFNSSYDKLQNQNGWVFSAKNGQLDIYNNLNTSMSTSYAYSSFKFNNSQIQDFNSNSFPEAIFPNITFQPRCFEPRLYLNFKPPFIIIADPYWPILTVMEQGGYKVFEKAYAKNSDYYFQQQERDINYIRYFSVCPDGTFQYKGQCLRQCPSPYFHQMRGKVGKCRLMCEEYTPIDTKNRICSCTNSYLADTYNSQIITSCPSGSLPYLYGCYCTANNMYFDSKLTFSCVLTCPAGTFANDGLCVKCPSNCDSCGIDTSYRMFLSCQTCQQGYTLKDGQCFKNCNTNLGNSLINGVCTPCKDKNCVDCTDNANICKKCSLLYSLYNGTCLSSCPTNTRQVYSNFFDTQCLAQSNNDCTSYISNHYKGIPYLLCDSCNNSKIPFQNTCVSTCPLGYSPYTYINKITNKTYVHCTCSSGLTINDQCVNIPSCPIKMTYDIYSNSCLSCPFGCITCQGMTCTSCYPGYFLYISPQAVICRRQSPLFPCDDQYSMWNGQCLVQQYQNLQMTQCRKLIPNCKVCPYLNTTTCVACQQGYYLYNNTCVQQCPNQHIIYKNVVCIMTELDNCDFPILESLRQDAILNITYIQKNNPYKYYITNMIEPANDPVGYIPFFQLVTNSRRITDGLFRETWFFEPRWSCLKCASGYGLSDDFQSCQPCITPCATCYMAKSSSCLTSISSDPSNQNLFSCTGYIEYSTGKCLKSCSLAETYPILINNVLYCKSTSDADYARIDSAIYLQQDGSKIAYFVFQNQMPSNTKIWVKIQKSKSALSKIPHRLLPSISDSYQKQVSLQDNYFQILSGVDQDVFIVNFTSSINKLQSVQGYYPPNLVYGSTALNTHPEFMKTWLAIIGQIMSVVIIVMHCVYVGNQLLYKVDNLIILTQTIYYFSFVKVLVGKLLAQYYYGWIFAHAGFWINFFKTPDQYRENEAPASYKLATTDANFIRNAGYSISFLIVYIAAWSCICAGVYAIYKIFQKKQIWNPRIANASLFAGIEFFSMNIMYWAIAHMQYRQDCQNCDESYYFESLIWAIIFALFIVFYTIGRFVFNKIGGIYMTKRVLIAVILPSAFENLAFIAPIVIVEIMFVLARFIVESPKFTKEKLFILGEFGANLLVYLLLFLCSNVSVSTIIISVVLFCFIVVLMSDFVDMYLQSMNQWALQSKNKVQQVQSNMQRAHTVQHLTKSDQQMITSNATD